VTVNGRTGEIDHGSVVIAAITSCTNTSNPSVLIGAGLLAKKAVEAGLTAKAWVKTSLAPGSRVVTDYLQASGLLPYLEQLGFHVVGYGCTTCIGNSGPLPEAVAAAVTEHDLVAAAVISGNRNFEGRVHPQVKANYLASPVLVVAYALAGSLNVDLATEALGNGKDGRPVHLKDIWPSQAEVQTTMAAALRPEVYRERYGEAFDGDDNWRSMPVPEGDLYAWDAQSTYIQEAPFFADLAAGPRPMAPVRNAKVLGYFGDSITTDHISPAGSIPSNSPTGVFFKQCGVQPVDYNTYGARRGNHEVMMRGTFGNIRLKNRLTPDVEGDWTVHQPSGERLRIYDASMRYQQEGTPLLVLAGKEYGSGSSRDWAAKGPSLLGVRAVIAESYERIHRSNLVGMGVLPLQFPTGQSAQSFGLTGFETYDIEGIDDGMRPNADLKVTARRADGTTVTFQARSRIDTPVEIDYYKQGGVLQTVLNKIRAGAQ
jgi:aconitate hydratase